MFHVTASSGERRVSGLNAGEVQPVRIGNRSEVPLLIRQLFVANSRPDRYDPPSAAQRAEDFSGSREFQFRRSL